MSEIKSLGRSSMDAVISLLIGAAKHCTVKTRDILVKMSTHILEDIQYRFESGDIEKTGIWDFDSVWAELEVETTLYNVLRQRRHSSIVISECGYLTENEMFISDISSQTFTCIFGSIPNGAWKSTLRRVLLRRRH